MVVQLYVLLCVFVSSLFCIRAYDLLLCLGAAERGRPETAEAGRWWGALAASATTFAAAIAKAPAGSTYILKLESAVIGC